MIETDDTFPGLTMLDDFIDDLLTRFNNGLRPESVIGYFGEHGVTYGTDEDGREYATVGFNLPENAPAYAEIEDGTYGALQGLRFYLSE